MMDLEEAMSLVLELARSNSLDPLDPEVKEDEILSDEAVRQKEACDTVEDFIVNQLGED